MGADETICRICLQIIEEELPYSVLRSNEALLEDLKLISASTFNNLKLTEEPSICELCEKTVKQLATFKKAIISIEATLQDSNSMSIDDDATCRLCLLKFEDLMLSWRDRKGLFIQCDLPMASDIESPSKICQDCDTKLKNLNDFLWASMKNEAVIVKSAKTSGTLTFKDLLSISSTNRKCEETISVEEPLQVTVTKTPNTYQKRRLRSNNLPSSSKEPVAIAPTLEETQTSIIDVPPASSTDVTLGTMDDLDLSLQVSAEDLEEELPEANAASVEMEDELNNDILAMDVVEYQIPIYNNNLSQKMFEEEQEESVNEDVVDMLEGRGVEVVPQKITEGVVTRKRKVRAVQEVANKKRATKVAKEEEDDDVKKFKKPVEVTIIKSNKRTKKAELDKTWKELTAKPKQGVIVQDSGDVEIQLVNSRRGRPKKPETQRKAVLKKQTVWFYCDLCSFKSYAKNSLVAHQLIHNLRGPDAPILHCNLCPFKSPSAEVMRTHMTNHQVASLTYKCIFCDDVFKKKVSCMYHTLKHDDRDIASQFYCMVYNGNSEEEVFECYQCCHQDADEASMPDHVIEHTVETVKHCLVTTHKCDQCLYITKDQELLERHKAMHKNEKSAKGKKVKVKEEHNEEVIYKCDKCHYMSKNKRSLSNHKGLKHNRSLQPIEPPGMKKEEEGPLYYCNECSYSTPRKVNLPRHQLVHRTKANMEFFECSHCIFETKHRRSYTRHLEVVHGLIS